MTWRKFGGVSRSASMKISLLESESINLLFLEGQLVFSGDRPRFEIELQQQYFSRLSFVFAPLFSSNNDAEEPCVVRDSNCMCKLNVDIDVLIVINTLIVCVRKETTTDHLAMIQRLISYHQIKGVLLLSASLWCQPTSSIHAKWRNKSMPFSLKIGVPTDDMFRTHTVSLNNKDEFDESSNKQQSDDVTFGLLAGRDFEKRNRENPTTPFDRLKKTFGDSRDDTAYHRMWICCVLMSNSSAFLFFFFFIFLSSYKSGEEGNWNEMMRGTSHRVGRVSNERARSKQPLSQSAVAPCPFIHHHHHGGCRRVSLFKQRDERTDKIKDRNRRMNERRT